MEEEGLFDLLDRSIDPPDAGVINFKALRGLLHNMLQRLYDMGATLDQQLQEASESSGQEEEDEDELSKCMNLIEDLVKENQELKEKSCIMEKEVETLQNQLNGYVAVEDMPGILDTEKQKIIEELRDRMGTPGPPDTSGEIKYDSLEARVQSLEGGQENILDQVNQLKTQRMERSGEEPAKPEATVSQRRDSRPEPQPYLQADDLRDAVQKLDEEMQNVKQDLLRIEQQKSSPDMEIKDTREDQEPPWLPGMVDLSTKINLVFQRYENLQSIVSDFMTQKASDKPLQIAETPSELSDEKHEKLETRASPPIKDHEEEQRHIEHLYKTVKELDERKADKIAVEIGKDIESDMQALENRIVVCDTNTVELKKGLQDLHNNFTDHEENCQKVTEKVFRELDSKVNHYELDPLKKQLKYCQTRIRKHSQSDSDSAAAVKLPLKTRFSCLSCDRPVYMVTPGPCWPSVPKLPNLPSQKHHNRLRPVTNLGLCESLPTKKSMEQITMFGKNDPCNIEGHSCKGSCVENENLWFPEDSLPLIVQSQPQVSSALANKKHPSNEGCAQRKSH
ncbi:glutamine-rich protein 2 isoform X1 [Clarias gariepinus]|uniref:glutamine-rich protein 2 isoform X1 n=1 Tax=Clarias gariepinus TaxID=13013 RepID=UPI00234D55AD|nr:glutamine-rich protein 2 isoform X1 [Clarias gariepinus]